MHVPSFTDISMVIYHYGAIAAHGSEGANIIREINGMANRECARISLCVRNCFI